MADMTSPSTISPPGTISTEEKARAEANKGATAAEDEKKDGGCRVGRRSSSSVIWAALAVGLGLLTRRRR